MPNVRVGDVFERHAAATALPRGVVTLLLLYRDARDKPAAGSLSFGQRFAVG